MEIMDMLSVAGVSALKIWPAIGLAVFHKMSALEIFISVTVGGISGVIFFAVWGTRVKEWLRVRRESRRKKPKRLNYKRLRIILRIWKKFGIYGISFLTPPFLSPPIGAIIAVAFGETPRRIILYMSVSTVFWAIFFAFFADKVIDLF